MKKHKYFAYYNEIDTFSSEWLRQLIKAGHIADGEVDTRSIEDVLPDDLRGFTQCHFFAGIGVWSYSLRRAGWPDERPVWTGSCPCQPFSTAGKGKGFADERHLWPAFFHLIKQRRPVKVFGEQVASKDGLAWLDLVHSDLEGAGYAVGSVDSCAAGFGAPHLRQRVYWVADSDEYGCNKMRECITKARDDGTIGNRTLIGMADTRSEGLPTREQQILFGTWRREERGATEQRSGPFCNVANAETIGWNKQREDVIGGGKRSDQKNLEQRFGSCGLGNHNRRPSPVNGRWANADWVFCRDGKWRAVEPGTFPLAHGAPNRVGRLRGYGNAIVAPQAEAFIRAFL